MSNPMMRANDRIPPDQMQPRGTATNVDAWDQPIDNNRNDMRDNSTRTGNTDNNNPDNKNNQNNNGGDNEDEIDSIWSDIKKENTQPGGQQQQQLNNQQQPVTKTAEERVKEYLKAEGLEGFTLSDKDKEELTAGNFDNFNSRINGFIQQSHLKAVQNINTLMTANIEAAVTKAVNASKSAFAGDKLLDAMHGKLSWTKDPIVSPVAQTVLQRFIDRGASQEDAIKGVEKYFDRVNERRGITRPVNQSRNGNFQASGTDNNNVSGDADWLEILRAKR